MRQGRHKSLGSLRGISLALAPFITLLVESCASVNSVSLTPIPAQRSGLVSATVSRTIFLGFNFDNDFVDKLALDLKQKCPGGIISGILTKDEVISYFLVFTRRVTASGYCSAAVAHNKHSTRSSASEDETSPSTDD
ncbi:MAG: hypothetical protein C5B49_05245 [Bdellovibrio sp.]|nr:MAG: hypothetical protein C5B49_05245 [Bdellovibrio sp.]